MKAIFPDYEFVYADAEFTPDNHTPSGLVSLALASRFGALYVVNAEADREDFCSSDFRRDHIWSKLPLMPSGELDITSPSVMPYDEIRRQVAGYFHDVSGGRNSRQSIGFVADHSTQDMQRIHDLFGNNWGTMPKSIPRHPLVDIATLEDLAGVVDDRLPSGLQLPGQREDQIHHAMYDARWDQDVHAFLLKHSRAVRVASGVERLEN